MTKALFHGTGMLFRFYLRRDRTVIAAWLVITTALTVGMAASFPVLFPTEQERQALAATMRNPAVTAMVGPAYSLDNYHYGAMIAHEMLLFTAVAAGIMSILLVLRHTRQDEESGRLEMVRSLPVGRLANTAAALGVAACADAGLAVSAAAGLAALGIETVDFYGSLLYGAVLGAAGLFFAAATALIAQVTQGARAASGISFAVLGGSYLVRAAGDVSSEALALASPLGLILRSQVYVHNRWWPIGVLLLVTAAVAVLALCLNGLRDLGAGLIPERAGRSHAGRWLAGPLGLTLRLQRTSLIAWSAAMFVVGASYGSVFGDIETFFASSELMQRFLPPADGSALTEQFVAVIILVQGMIGTVPPLLTVLRLNAEERANRTEPVLSGAVSRHALLGRYILVAACAAALLQFLSALGFWLASRAVLSEPLPLESIFGASFAYVPAVLFFVGLGAVCVGMMPRAAVLVWLYLGYSFLVMYLGAPLRFPGWLKLLTPFGYVPALPVEPMDWKAAAVLTALAVLLAAMGMAAYRRRDVHG